MNFSLFKEQIALLDKLKEKPNGLIIAKTGAGKTVLALKKIQSIFNQKNKFLFLAPTNILIEQHKLLAENIFVGPSFLISTRTRLQEKTFEAPGLYFITGAYAKVLVQKKILNLNSFEALFFDEAHKAISLKSSYSFIASSTIIKRFGFTATSGTKKHTKQILKNLKIQEIFYSQSPFNHKRAYSYCKLDFHPKQKKLFFSWKRYFEETYAPYFKLFQTNFEGGINIWLLKYKGLVLKKVLKENNLSYYKYLAFFHKLYLIYLYFFESSKSYFLYYQKIKERPFFSLREKDCFQKLIKIKDRPSKKFVYIKDNLDLGSTNLVFFENYQTACCFYQYLLDNGFLKSELVLIAGKAKLKKKERDQNIAKTKTGGIKVVIATSVIEEGVNISSVDLVFFHTPVLNKIRLVQRAGRTGRYRDGKIFILGYLGTKQAVQLEKLEKIVIPNL